MTHIASTDQFVRKWLSAAIAVVALGALASPGLSRDYNVTHNFTFTPGGNIMPTVWAIHYQHAMVKEWRPYCREFDVNPPASAQPTGWKSGRKDRLGANGLVFNGKEGHWVQATTALVVIPPTGFGPVTYTVSANTNCNPTAQASSQVTVAPYGPGSPVTGTISSFGYARPTLVPGQLAAKALAFSATTIHARGGWLMRTGGFRWRPIVRNTAAGSAARTRVQQRDPIEFVVEDLETGEVVQGTLLSIDVDIATAEEEGGFTWEDNQVNIEAGTDVIFEIDQTSPHVSPSGSLLLEIIGGVVTQSYGSGAYANVPLPAVGTPLPITFDLLSEIEFDYDLGDFQGHDLNVDMYMGGAGEGYPELGDVPTPGDLNCDGAVNAFDIDAFVMALANPAGYEMMFPDCEILSADCNDDGIVDAFDIDPFVELLTGG